MSKKIRCRRCMGAGFIRGGGMMRVDCNDCDGMGKVYPEDVEEVAAPLARNFVIDKRSKEYKEAIKKIKAINPDLSDQEVSDIFDKEFNKLED